MAFNLALFRLGRSNEKGKELERIEKLRDELVKLGYVPGEVDYLIRAISNGKKLSTLDAKKLKRVEEALKYQIGMVSECLRVVKGN